MRPSMILNLLAVSLNDQPLSQPIAARFDASGGTIGRADHNTLALPDPERHISRVQAEIVAAGGGFLIRNDAAARNPIIAGARTLAPGEAATLSHADPVRIGGYLLEVRLDRDEPDAERTQGRVTGWPSSWSAPAQSTPAPAAPLPAMPPPAPGTMASSNPFADLLGPAPTPLGPAPSAMPGAPAAVRLPDDFDPFKAPAPPPATSQRPPALRTDPFAGLGLGSDTAAPSIDRAFDLGGGGADPLAAFLASTAAPPDPLATDPLVLLGGAPPPAAPPARVQRDDLPALHAAYVPPRVATPPPPPPAQEAPPASTPWRPEPAPAAAVTVAAAPDDLWQAFCAGTGIDPALPPEVRAAALREAGRMLRSAVEGALQLIAVRATTKHELRAEVTQIRARSNNPLKFSPDATAALQQLLQPPLRGFLEGPAAMDDAMHDLVGHSIGTVAGMRAAIEGMLDRFDPAALEAKLGAGSVLDKLLPMNRSARLWDLYVEHHRRIRDDAQDDFHALFGKAFLTAYQQQVQRLARAPSRPQPAT